MAKPRGRGAAAALLLLLLLVVAAASWLQAADAASGTHAVLSLRRLVFCCRRAGVMLGRRWRASSPADRVRGVAASLPRPAAGFCSSKCGVRCGRAGARARGACMRTCGLCCEECNCVPTGGRGGGGVNECPCYRNMLTAGPRKRPKCP